MALPETGRYFVALDLGPQVLGTLGEAQGELRGSGGPPIRWTSTEAMHLTLKFLGGSVPVAQAFIAGDLAGRLMAGDGDG